MNWFDRTIGWFSPVAQLRRERARIGIEMARRAMLRYEGAQTGRRTDGWITSGGSANAELGPDLSRLRNRSRDLARNNSFAKKALRTYVDSAIGNGIVPRADTGDKKLDQKIDQAFLEWSEGCDADGQLDFYGLQRLICRTERLSGESLVRYRIRESSDAKIPLELQILEPDYIDTAKNWFVDDQGKYTIYGVQFDKWGRRIGYWLFGSHPGEVIRTNPKDFISQIVPADQILHIYDKDRPGAVRGAPNFHSIVLKLRDIDEYSDAEIVRKKVEACLAAFVTTPEGQNGATLGQASTATDNSQRIERLEPGMIEYCKPGEEITFNTPTGSGGFREYKTTELHEVAAGADVTYESMTGDLSLVNYSSYRAGYGEFQTAVEAYRWLLLAPMALNPIWRKFIDIGVVAGVIPEAKYGVKWTAPAFRALDPQKENEADKIAIRAGLKTFPEAVSERGYVPERQIAEIASTNKAFDEAGIILDIDPRNVNDRGQLHGTAAEDTGEKAPPDDK
jgi:lambda family phage portal protein